MTMKTESNPVEKLSEGNLCNCGCGNPTLRKYRGSKRTGPWLDYINGHRASLNPAVILADWNNGKQLAQLAQEHGCKVGVIRYALKKAKAQNLGPRYGKFRPAEEPLPMAALLWPHLKA